MRNVCGRGIDSVTWLCGSCGRVAHNTCMYVHRGVRGVRLGWGGEEITHAVCACAVRGTETNHAHTAHAHPQL